MTHKGDPHNNNCFFSV